MSMTRWASFTTLVLISVVGFFIQAPTAAAENVQITAVVAGPGGPGVNPIVEFSGVAAPGATLTVFRNGAELSSFVADSGAAFSKIYTEQPTGQQVYELRAVDTDGHNLAPLTFGLDLVVGTTTSLSNIFLGPSITTSLSSVMLTQSTTVFGQTYPNSDVTVTISTAPIQTVTVQSNSQGRWSANISADNLGLGTFSLYARTNSLTAGLSELSLTVPVTVIPYTPPPTNTNTNPPSNTNTTNSNLNSGTNSNANTNSSPTGNSNTAPPVTDPFAGKLRADLNGDGRVNLIDLSILLFYWQQRNPANSRADISDDGIVTMVDFSIMLFQWTG